MQLSFCRSFVLVLAIHAGAGCLEPPDEPELGASAEALTRDMLRGLGYTCSAFDHGWSTCTQCYPPAHPGGPTICDTMYCTQDPDAPCTEDPPDTATLDLAALEIWMEAEDGVLSSPMVSAASAGASSGLAVQVPSSTTTSGGSVRFTFTVPDGGRTLYPWGYTSAASTASNAFDVRVDSGGYQPWELPVTGAAWSWSRAGDAGAQGVFLAAGTHTLRVYRREAGARLDRVLLTTSPTFVPSLQSIEAESLGRVAPMQVGSTSPTIFGTRYLWVPPGAGTGGSFDLMPSLPSGGLYSVWGRTSAASTAQDSFYVSVDFDAHTAWALPVTGSTGWAWDPFERDGDLARFFFAAGSTHVIRVEQREAGAKIDRLIVTNDPAFVPVDVGSPGSTL